MGLGRKVNCSHNGASLHAVGDGGVVLHRRRPAVVNSDRRLRRPTAVIRIAGESIGRVPKQTPRPTPQRSSFARLAAELFEGAGLTCDDMLNFGPAGAVDRPLLLVNLDLGLTRRMRSRLVSV